eukprot:COSAG01_NODE_258_length_20077_cov_124.162429_3_plen_278_part_00
MQGSSSRCRAAEALAARSGCGGRRHASLPRLRQWRALWGTAARSPGPRWTSGAAPAATACSWGSEAGASRCVCQRSENVLDEGRLGWTDVRGGGRTQGIDHLEKQRVCPDRAVVPPCPDSAPRYCSAWLDGGGRFAPLFWRCDARPLVRCAVARARQLAELHDAGGRCQFTCLDVERLLVSSAAVDAGMKQLQGPFDLVHCARFLHRPLLPALRDHFVRPGGMIVCECPSSPTDTRPLLLAHDIAAHSDAVGSHVSHRHRPHVHVRLRKVWAAARSR